MHVFYQWIEVLEQRLALLRVYPPIEVSDSVIADDVYPLILGTAARFGEVCRQVPWVFCLGNDRLAPPGAIVVDLVAADTVGKDHCHWRIFLFVAGEDL